MQPPTLVKVVQIEPFLGLGMCIERERVTLYTDSKCRMTGRSDGGLILE